jgi:hypothetical protein
LHKKGTALTLFLFFYFQIISAQQIELKGEFIENEAKIGEEISFALSVKYDKNLNILFPDSTFNFTPFEYYSRTYFKTKSDSTQSFDSVVYKLATFEIDSIQFLQLPVFIVNNQDSITAYHYPDSVRLVEIITEIPENPELKANTELVSIKKQFNYPYLLIGLGVVSFIALAIALFFGKQIAKAWQVYRLNKIHKKFTGRFFNLIRDVSGNNPNTTAEHVLSVWKNYLERLEKKPISKLTTKEILVLHRDEQLKNNLKQIDRNVYGNEKGKDLFSSFDYLMKFSVKIYNQKITEIKNR